MPAPIWVRLEAAGDHAFDLDHLRREGAEELVERLLKAAGLHADGEPIGAPVPLTNGTAVSPATGLDAGDHVITANYEGDDRFAGGSDSLDQEVAAARTTTVVASAPNPSVVGQPITVTATVSPVSPATGTPQGAVQFEIDGVPGAFATLVGGSAEIQVGAGEHATYRFVNDDVPAVVLPLTGGAASDLYLLLGGALMAAFVAFAAWHASRRMKRGHA